MVSVKGELSSVKDDVASLKDGMVSVKGNVASLTDDMEYVKDELATVKRDVKHLKKQAIRMQAMDDAILDEVERVHHILIDHKADRTAHVS